MIQMPSFLQSAASLIEDIPGVYVEQTDLETTISTLALNTVLISASALFILTLLAMLFSNKYESLKMPLFVLMAVTMAGSALTLISSTVYLNTRADSGGPVHWHADVEYWACGNELELRDPTGFLSNKIGTATLHEHDDHRVHLEGVVVDDEIDASLGKFMSVTGGAITAEQMVIPLNSELDDGDANIYEDEEDGDGPAETNPELLDPYIIDDPELGKIAYFKDGDTCGSEVSDVQVFVYNYNGEDKTYEQTKLENPRDYVITDDPNVPPGDCIIFEFGPEREKTDKLCEQYGIRDIDRCAEFGVADNQRAICELTQVNYDESMTVPKEQAAPVVEEDETEETESSGNPATADAVHLDPELEAQRIACEESLSSIPAGANTTPECETYDTAVSNSPEAQAEIDATADQPNPEDTDESPSEEEVN